MEGDKVREGGDGPQGFEVLRHVRRRLEFLFFSEGRLRAAAWHASRLDKRALVFAIRKTCKELFEEFYISRSFPTSFLSAKSHLAVR